MTILRNPITLCNWYYPFYTLSLTRLPQKRQGPEPSCSQTMRPQLMQLLMRLCFWARHSQAWRPGSMTASLPSPSLAYRLTNLFFFFVEEETLPSWACGRSGQGKYSNTDIAFECWAKYLLFFGRNFWLYTNICTIFLLLSENAGWTAVCLSDGVMGGAYNFPLSVLHWRLSVWHTFQNSNKGLLMAQRRKRSKQDVA